MMSLMPSRNAVPSEKSVTQIVSIFLPLCAIGIGKKNKQKLELRIPLRSFDVFKPWIACWLDFSSEKNNKKVMIRGTVQDKAGC